MSKPMWRVAIMVLALLDTGCMAVAAEPLEDPTNILAAQLRDQGYECNRPKSAERDVQASKPDEEVWIVQCENAKYRMRLDPDGSVTIFPIGIEKVAKRWKPGSDNGPAYEPDGPFTEPFLIEKPIHVGRVNAARGAL